jgi:hypothetical protein
MVCMVYRFLKVEVRGSLRNWLINASQTNPISQLKYTITIFPV